MNKKLIKELEEDFIKAYESHRIGDLDGVPQINVLGGEDMNLENIFILTYNLLKVNQHRIDKLENNLKLLADRMWNTTEDFNEEELYEIRNQLEMMDLDKLQNVKNNLAEEAMFCLEDDEKVMETKAKMLMSKIMFSNRGMNDTFNSLVESTKTEREDEWYKACKEEAEEEQNRIDRTMASKYAKCPECGAEVFLMPTDPIIEGDGKYVACINCNWTEDFTMEEI